jgi:PAS domain S-box-containing protein
MQFAEECFPPECYRYYLQGLPRIVEDVNRDEWSVCLTDFMRAMGVRSKMVAPIVQGHQEGTPTLWGLLILHACRDRREWQTSEAAVLQLIANQLAIAIQQAELYQKLQASEERSRHAFEQAVNGMALVRLDGYWLRVNPALCQMLGYTETELMQLPLPQITAPADLERLWLKLQELLSGSLSVELEHRLIDKQERLLWILNSVSLVKDPKGIPLYYVMQIQDITERRRIEQIKKEFISVVSHELRTPLASIRGALGLLAAGVLAQDPDIFQQMLDIAHTETDRLSRLVNDILDLERLETQQITLVRQWCDAVSLMQQAGDSVYPLAEASQIFLQLVPDQVQVWADPDRIVQVLINLLSNAIKFSPPDSRVTLRCCRQTDHVLFQVQDQGRGIPADQLEKIFGKFQQVDTSDARDKGGTGLGLAICRTIVQQHEGEIWAESVLGQGSSFSFTLPLPKGTAVERRKQG